jgi:signal peptidase I
MEIGAVVVLGVVGFFMITTFVAQPYEVEQASMDTTLAGGQYVVVDKLTPDFDGYSRGDIVVFNPVRRDPSCSDPASAPLAPTPYIKRVIGEPGDLVELHDGTVYINGAQIQEPYLRGFATGALGRDRWLVPPGRLFVMGDNRDESRDSRSDELGEICINDVIGRAVLRYWPLNKVGILETPTYSGVPTPGAVTTPTAVPATPTQAPTAATSTPSASPPGPSAPVSAPVEKLRAQVIERRPHDVTSFTEGLVLAGGRLYESSAYGAASLREVDPDSGAILRSATIPSGNFAEGIAVVDDRVIQLTWQQHTAFNYDLSDFQQLGTFAYDTEGWGLCDDGTRLVMSDGTSRLYFRDRSTFELLGSVIVTNEQVPVELLNELECVDGQVYANVWHSDTIVRIDPSNGAVNGVIDASGLFAPDEAPRDEEAVLNGIAYDATTDTFLLTGKLWPTLFEVHLVLQ